MEPEPKPPQSNPSADPKEKSEVERLRDEFAEQFGTLKTSFEGQVAELTKQNEDLKKHNQELERALLRSAVTEKPPTPEPPKEKTPEELYKEQVDALSKKTLEIMSKEYTI